MSDKSETDPEDIKLFRDTIGPVVPVENDKVLSRPPRPEAVPFKTIEDEKNVIAELLEGDLDPAVLETGEELLYRGPGIQNNVFRKLRNGNFTIEAGIDLHGMTVPVAKDALSTFLAECRNKNRKCIKIIHGKGIGSRDGKPVIKNKVNKWLRQRKDVLAFCSAPPNDGGTGAIYVLIKR